MHRAIRFAPLALTLALLPGTALTGVQAQEVQAREVQAQASAVDYAGFVELAGELGEYRQARLLGWQDWHTRAQQGQALILDTRSAEAFAAGHIEGAVNLPFSDFTDQKLADLLGADRDRPIFIYCNNNFIDNRPPVALKRTPLALNIPTFINLYGYGYTNVWELGDMVWLAQVPWVSGE